MSGDKRRMSHLEPVVGRDLVILERLDAGPRLVLVRVDDEAEPTAEAGGRVHLKADLASRKVRLQGVRIARCEEQGAISKELIREQGAKSVNLKNL